MPPGHDLRFATASQACTPAPSRATAGTCLRTRARR